MNNKGSNNPNWKGGIPPRVCAYCKKTFYRKASKGKYEIKYCNRECYSKTRPRPIKICKNCGKEFACYPSNVKTRLYCSYECSKEAGTPSKAGTLGISAMLSKYGAKKDANHKEIVEALEKAGAFVKDLSGVGWGAPDIVVWTGLSWEMIEIKNPKTSYGRQGFTKKQLKWQEEWNGVKVHLVRSIDEVLALWKSFPKKKSPAPILKPDKFRKVIKELTTEKTA